MNDMTGTFFSQFSISKKKNSNNLPQLTVIISCYGKPRVHII